MAAFACSSAARPPASTCTVASGRGVEVAEELVRGRERVEHRLGHAVVERCGHPRVARAVPADAIRDPALDAHDVRKAAAVRDVGRLRRPRRDRAEPRNDEMQRAIGLRPGLPLRLAVVEQLLQDLVLAGSLRTIGLDEVPEGRGGDGEAGVERPEDRLELRAAERGQRNAAAQLQDGHDARDYTAPTGGARARPVLTAKAALPDSKNAAELPLT